RSHGADRIHALFAPGETDDPQRLRNDRKLVIAAVFPVRKEGFIAKCRAEFGELVLEFAAVFIRENQPGPEFDISKMPAEVRCKAVHPDIHFKRLVRNREPLHDIEPVNNVAVSQNFSDLMNKKREEAIGPITICLMMKQKSAIDPDHAEASRLILN